MQSGKERKAYTLTKRRERWTDKEHELFLEAVKLYGREWPKIEGQGPLARVTPPCRHIPRHPPVSGCACVYMCLLHIN